MKSIEQYCRVRVITDAHQKEGVARGAIGYVIEIYGEEPKEYEVEFSDRSSGVTTAQVVAREGEIEMAE